MLATEIVLRIGEHNIWSSQSPSRHSWVLIVAHRQYTPSHWVIEPDRVFSRVSLTKNNREFTLIYDCKLIMVGILDEWVYEIKDAPVTTPWPFARFSWLRASIKFGRPVTDILQSPLFRKVLQVKPMSVKTVGDDMKRGQKNDRDALKHKYIVSDHLSVAQSWTCIKALFSKTKDCKGTQILSKYFPFHDWPKDFHSSWFA